MMKLYDAYKAYLIEELNDGISIQKNNDIAYYDVLEEINGLSNDTLCVLNHLYINKGQEDAFEQKFLQRNKHLQHVDGFEALRFLRPRMTGRHYIIITLWKDRQSFYNWQNSTEYQQTHKHRGTSKGADVKIINRELSYNIRIELAESI
ncbi:Signal transduction protein TRAP [Staphylococcus schweitzeri]|uniref:Signal transduction protein TRAP n=2 Tax=Staphylococcus schweitzeri TaxID=1654388 RepID=A0A077UMC6_9STAP|nr:Signal transduction protein TRAP [Staphylococcus schweitzeri]CDR52056.1 Signal transduction protein TRAP [Staphylococcus schweitzeri]CDR52807.1 Signal transduction protein TRAP [Staphylococcus schweitzeri]CDR61410.1 Signal transduction protein TRAP [Staphylococcus schweitzeri]VEE67059.1 heme-degrading monooxygenase IsdG [Staphylococcus schweitzeri]